MTTATTTAPASPATASAARRIWNVVRLHVANPVPTLVLPWLITLAIFGLNLAIWLLVVNAAGGVENLDENAFQYNGGIMWIVVFMMVVAVQTMNLSFRFALGFSVTRRDFFAGSALYFVLLALMYSVGIAVLAAIERATDGWGVDGRFFSPWFLADASYATVWFSYFMAMLLSFAIGAAVATVWVRWKAYGLYAFFVSLGVLGVGTAWAISSADAWGTVIDFFTGNSTVVIMAWTLPLTILCGLAGNANLRRATPGS